MALRFGIEYYKMIMPEDNDITHIHAETIV